MTFYRTFEVDDVRGEAPRVELDLKEPHGDHPAVLTLSGVDQQLLHTLVVASPDGLILSEGLDVADDEILLTVPVNGRWTSPLGMFVVLGPPISGQLRVDKPAYERLQDGVVLTLHARTPVVTPPTTGWRFALALGDAVQVPFQQVCELGVIVGTAGGRLERGAAMVFAGPGTAPIELHDWCHQNDITCGVVATAGPS